MSAKRFPTMNLSVENPPIWKRLATFDRFIDTLHLMSDNNDAELIFGEFCKTSDYFDVSEVHEGFNWLLDNLKDFGLDGIALKERLMSKSTITGLNYKDNFIYSVIRMKLDVEYYNNLRTEIDDEDPGSELEARLIVLKKGHKEKLITRFNDLCLSQNILHSLLQDIRALFATDLHKCKTCGAHSKDTHLLESSPSKKQKSTSDDDDE